MARTGRAKKPQIKNALSVDTLDGQPMDEEGLKALVFTLLRHSSYKDVAAELSRRSGVPIVGMSVRQWMTEWGYAVERRRVIVDKRTGQLV